MVFYHSVGLYIYQVMVIAAQDVADLRKKTGSGMMDCKQALVEAGGDFEKAVDILRKKGRKVSMERSARTAGEGAVFSYVSEDHTSAWVLSLNSETDFVARNSQFLELGNRILEVGVKNQVRDLDTLKKLKLGDYSVEEALVHFMGTIGEKIAISDYAVLTGDVVVVYSHTGNTLAVLVALQGDRSAQAIEAGRDVAMQIAAMSPLAVSQDRIDQAIIDRELSVIQEQVALAGHEGHKAEMIAQGKLKKFLQENTLLDQCFVKDNKLTIRQYLQSVSPSLEVMDFKRICVGG